MPSFEWNTAQIHPFWKIPSLVGSVVVAKVIVINYVIGGLSWVHLISLADGTARFQVSNYSQLSDFNPTQQLVKNKAVNAPIKFEKIVMVMISYVVI